MMSVVRQAASILALCALAATLAGTLGGASDHRVTQKVIGGAKLGLPRSAYIRAFGKPSFTSRFGHGLKRMVYANRELAVYLSRRGRGIAVLTSAKEYRTHAGVGPCSKIRALKKAYRGRLVAKRRAGHIVAYRLRRLLFVAQAGQVGAVMLSNSAFPASVAVNAGQCGGGEEG